MPGFTSHIMMGGECLESMPDCRLKNVLELCPVSYTYGLQGPDIYFYYPVLILENGMNNIGSIMHEQGTAHYLSVSLGLLNGMEEGFVRDHISAYLAGFIAHVFMDCICHPYVYARIGFDLDKPHKKYRRRHAKLEDELDLIMLRNCRGIYPKQFDMGPLLRYTEVEKAALSVFLADSTSACYGRRNAGPDVFSMNETTASHLLAFFRKEILLRGIPNVSSDPQDQLLNLDKETWTNPWDRRITSDLSFPELFVLSVRSAVKAFLMLDEYLRTGERTAKIRLLRFVGNRSLHSGLDV